MHSWIIRFLAACLLAVGLHCPLGASDTAAAASQGDVALTPMRVVFEGRKRSAEITLFNKGSVAVSYSLSMKNHRMSESGELQAVTAAGQGELYADTFIRFSPRRILLGPNQAQVVRLQLTKPAKLAAGEYRSHIVFGVVPNAQAGLSEPGAADDPLKVKIAAGFGIAIPIIVREGATAATVRIRDMTIQDGAADSGAVLSFFLEREGSRSVYGHLEVDLLRGGSAIQRLGGIKGVAVYTPLPVRKVSIPLGGFTVSSLQKAVLRIRYLDGENPESQTPVVLASATMRLE